MNQFLTTADRVSVDSKFTVYNLNVHVVYGLSGAVHYPSIVELRCRGARSTTAFVPPAPVYCARRRGNWLCPVLLAVYCSSCDCGRIGPLHSPLTVQDTTVQLYRTPILVRCIVERLTLTRSLHSFLISPQEVVLRWRRALYNSVAYLTLLSS